MNTTADNAAVVDRYLNAYFTGALATAKSLVADDFTFRAPLIEEDGSKDVFFAGAESKTQFVTSVRVLRQWAEGSDVSTLYELEISTPKGVGAMLLHEWHTVAGGQLTSSVMTFDTAAPAARLLHDALMASHD